MTTTEVRPELPPMPPRIEGLHRHRGYPVPWFVAWLDEEGEESEPGRGTPDFRVLATGAIKRAHERGLCWVCGQPRGAYMAFLVGPMCAVNKTSAEPPSHRECAEWSARACPFLTRPHARRREAGLPEDADNPAGVMIKRNPGVALVWVTRSYEVVTDPAGRGLIRFGDPTEVVWFCEGRAATRQEVMDSIATGLPSLRELCRNARDHRALDAQVKRAAPLLPVE